jgi:hypothetical protein
MCNSSEVLAVAAWGAGLWLRDRASELLSAVAECSKPLAKTRNEDTGPEFRMTARLRLQVIKYAGSTDVSISETAGP